MTTNVGNTDRVLRLVAGVFLLALAFVGPRTPIGYLGLVLIGTALLNFCPVYSLLGINTCRPGTR
jgi:hypothetical protein